MNEINPVLSAIVAKGGNALTSFTRLYIGLLLLPSFGIALLSLNPYNLEAYSSVELFVNYIILAITIAVLLCLPMLIVAAVLFVVFGGLKS
jgi:hypothetical protein